MLQALLYIPSLLHEKLENIIRNEEDTELVMPYIVAPTSLEEGENYHVLVEGVKVATTNSLIGAFKLLMASFYVFNIAYPKNLQATLSFLQILFLGINDNSKPNIKAVKLVAEISK